MNFTSPAKDVILLVEDEPAVQASVGRRLRFEGFRVEVAETGHQALERFIEVAPDLVILDVMLPGLDGFEVAERIRAKSAVPVIMLTARDQVSDRVRGLERGADDYLVKPFAIEELLARIRALLRRARPTGPTQEEVLSHEGLTLNPLTRDVVRSGQHLELTPREFEVLEFLLRHPRQVLRREQILEAIWGFTDAGTSNVVDVYVRQLREKLEMGGHTRLIQTVRGVGYTLRAP